MVSDKLQRTLNFMGASNMDIARYAKVDPSLVSHIKSGSREIKMNSASVLKIANGIYLFCDDRNIIPAFCSLFDGDSTRGSETIIESFIKWLFEDVTYMPGEVKPKKIPQFAANISPKLDRLMKLTDMSNIRLARTINVDSSYISRIRSGVRTPKSNLELIRNICSALTYRITEQNKVKDTARLMNISDELLGNNSDLQNELFIWLCDTNHEDFIPAAEMLLDKIETFSPDAMLPLPDTSSFTENIQNDTASVYKGKDGLRRAVIRFLTDASKDSENELWLYSDQDMDWMVGDEEFRLKWFALMAECAKSGVRVKIIHNIDRGMAEMVAAITSWLPLYMFGTIEPHYCTKRTDDRFSHTLFLCRGKACINASLIRGTESVGYYNYYTDTEMLDYFENGYSSLLKVSKPLVKLYGGDTVQTLLSESVSAENENFVRETPSLATMPKELLLTMLDRAGIIGDEYDKIVNRWKTENTFFKTTLKAGYFHELIPVIRDEIVFGGGIQSDIAEGVYYTPSELSEHVENILRLMEKYAKYRLYILPEAPFTNMKVAVDKERVIVSRMKSPQMSFVFNHPLMRDAFDNYISHLKGRCEQDKKAVKKALQAYL